MKKVTLLSILISLVLSLSLFLLARPTLVSALVDVTAGTVGIFETETQVDKKGFRQIVMRDQNGSVFFITSDNFTHDNPTSSKRNIVWMGQERSTWDIFLYNVDSDKTVKLTTTGNNVNPQITGSSVVWEGLRDGVWQIFMFDGMKIHQITKDANPKQDVRLSETMIVYSQKENEVWNVYTYDIATKITLKVTDQDSNRIISINENLVTWETSNDYENSIVEYNLMTKTYKKIDKNGEKDKIVGIDTSLIEATNANSEQDNNSLEPESISEKDILEELDIEEVIQSPETPESTPSYTPENIMDLEDVQESTNSAN